MYSCPSNPVCVPILYSDSHAFALQRLDRIDYRLSPSLLYLFTYKSTPHRFHTHSLTHTHPHQTPQQCKKKEKKRASSHHPPPQETFQLISFLPSTSNLPLLSSPLPFPFFLLPSPSPPLLFRDNIYPRSTPSHITHHTSLMPHPNTSCIPTLLRSIPTSPHLTSPLSKRNILLSSGVLPPSPPPSCVRRSSVLFCQFSTPPPLPRHLIAPPGLHVSSNVNPTGRDKQCKSESRNQIR